MSDRDRPPRPPTLGGPPLGAGGPPPIDNRLPPLRNIGSPLGPSSRDPFTPQLFHYSSSHHPLQQSHRPSLPAPSILPIHPRPHQPFPSPTATMGSQLPPPPPLQQPQYFTQSGQPIPPPPHMAMPHDPNAPMRYPIPNDGRMLSGGRHKKEIKRRTKTGCLTCRKRRIKCDEAHPICRNCQKSKRECLGYDPIFKSQQGPAAIQPAPNSTSAPAMQSSAASSTPYTSFSSAGFATPVSVSRVELALTALQASNTGNPTYPGFAGGAIDPNLDSAGATHAPPVNIEDILNVGSGLPPPTVTVPSTNISDTDREQVKQVFENVYAAATDKFLETKWFSSRGLTHLYNNPSLLEKYKVLLGRFNYTAASNFHENGVTQSLETHVIWETFLLARQVAASINNTNDPNTAIELNEGVQDAAKRVDIFEALITNQKLDPANALADAPAQASGSATTPSGTPKPALDDQLKTRERDFWRWTSRFCTLKDDAKRSSENPNEEIEKVLHEMRLLLDSRENRDILYSIAIIRHCGHQLADREGARGESIQAVSNDESDPRTKLQVAKDFINAEAGGKGTTQVSQRICGMAFLASNKR